MGSLYLISGNEEFSVKEHATELVCRLYGEIPEDNPELEVIRGDDDTEKFTAVLDRFLATIQTPPFLFFSGFPIVLLDILKYYDIITL